MIVFNTLWHLSRQWTTTLRFQGSKILIVSPCLITWALKFDFVKCIDPFGKEFNLRFLISDLPVDHLIDRLLLPQALSFLAESRFQESLKGGCKRRNSNDATHCLQFLQILIVPFLDEYGLLLTRLQLFHQREYDLFLLISKLLHQFFGLCFGWDLE